MDVQKGKVYRLFAGVDDAGGGAGVVPCHENDPGQEEAQAVKVVRGHFGDDTVVPDKDIVCHLAADDRGDALHRRQQRLGQRGVLALDEALFNLLRGAGNQVELVLSRRQGIVDARQDGTNRRHGVVDALDRVDDPAVLIDEDDVGVAAHDFDGDGQLDEVAHFVAGFKDEVQDAVKADLTNLQELCTAQMLAHQHTEHRGRFGVFKGRGGQVQARAVRTCREVELCTACTICRRLPQTQDEDHLLAGKLVDFIHPRADETAFQLMFDLTKQSAVKCHRKISFLSIQKNTGSNG